MHAPHVLTTWNDPRHGVKYQVLAFRRLTRPEVFYAVHDWLKERHGHAPTRGQEVKIFTSIGIGGSNS